MSDDFDDDGFDFDIDDSFLREVDNITAQATGLAGPASHQAQTRPAKSGAAPGGTRIPLVGQSRSPLPTTFSRPSVAGPSNPRPHALPSPDDFDVLPLPQEALISADNASARLVPPRTSIPAKQTTIPSARLGMARSASGSTSFQTHLNFRKESQATKGKRWDRTAFAESGRRISAEKAKAKGKGKYQARSWARDDDEVDEEEEEEDFEPLVPGPRPLVDVEKPYDPQRHLPNNATIDTYIYPTNRPKRDYQYEIVRACFTDNCLVALPTGLGKTFVAGVVMLNFYRWFPTGKIVFLAPTKPLVNQQIEACQMTCGIPSADAAVMTGSSVSAGQRAKKWEERRVFYCTPQTLDNDLKNGSIDPRDIVLAVFDEAHKASGSYAYTTILAYITAQNPYFRVLALTATPGADVPRVQAVVDALHISRIEIREAEAPEIRKYMNEKRTEKHFVKMGDVIEDFRDRFGELMKPHVKKLVDADILNDRDLDVKRLKPFRLTSKRMEIARDRTSGLKWALGPLQALEKMARAMGHLLEFSIGMFHTILAEIAGNTTAQGKKSMSKGSANSLRNNFEFQRLMRDVEAEINSIRVGRAGKTKADKHPKMIKTLELLLAHFSQAADDERDHGTKNDTRAMVFCSYREAVLEIVDMLNEHSGILSATKFVGQSQGKQEIDKGFNQKEQKKTIADFKEGKFNVLVSTSIGEEGLDIGEVDFVVIYDMPKQSIKLLQRIGRTGRKRDGKVHVLMSEGREDANWDTAQQTHREIQEEILHSRNLELFEDVERLLPPGTLPTCVEQEMPVDPWDPDEGKTRKRLAAADKEEKEQAKKAKKQRGHEIPEGGLEGFKSVAELLRDCGKMPSAAAKASLQKTKKKGTAKAAPVVTRIRARDADGNEIPDPWEETTQNANHKAAGEKSSRGKRQSDASVVSKRKKKVTEAVESESEEDEGLEDLDDVFANLEKRDKGEAKETIRRGTSNVKRTKTTTGAAPDKIQATESRAKSTIDFESASITAPSPEVETFDDDDAQTPLERPKPSNPSVPVPVKRPIVSKMAKASNKHTAKEDTARQEAETRRVKEQQEQDQAALDFFASATLPRRRGMTPPLVTPPSSPPAPRPDTSRPLSPDSPERTPPKQHLFSSRPPDSAMGGAKLSPGTAALVGFSQIAPIDLDWEDDLVSSPPPPPVMHSTPGHQLQASSPGAQFSAVMPSSGQQPSGTRRRIVGLSRPTPLRASASTLAMPPPPLPLHKSSPIVSSPAMATRPPPLVPSSPVVSPPPPLRRAGRSRPADRGQEAQVSETRRRSRRMAGRSPIMERSKRKKQRVARYLDLDAELSGSEGSSDEPLSDVETESDRLFAGEDFAPTQAPRGYNQHAAYMAGMSTQAAGRNGMNFRSRYDTEGFLAKARKPVLVSDEERTDGAETDENEYEMGSFVCDDEDISFETQTHTDPLDSQY